MPPLEPVPLAEVLAARNRIAGKAARTPLVRLNVDTAADIYLKLENLQPIGSFKIRGAGNALLKQKRAALSGSLVTSVERIATAIRTIAERNHVVAEGADAAAVAVALTGDAGSGKIVCVVSGGNIDLTTLATILRGDVPG